MNAENADNGIQENVDKIADDTRALLAATADVAEKKVIEARSRLSATLAAAKDSYAAIQKKAVQSAKATDKVIRERPYQAIGVALVVGALVGFIISSRRER